MVPSLPRPDESGFPGPTEVRSGPDGAAISDEELLKMNWYVEGVQA